MRAAQEKVQKTRDAKSRLTYKKDALKLVIQYRFKHSTE